MFANYRAQTDSSQQDLIFLLSYILGKCWNRASFEEEELISAEFNLQYKNISFMKLSMIYHEIINKNQLVFLKKEESN